jgi:rare lipoprotein A
MTCACSIRGWCIQILAVIIVLMLVVVSRQTGTLSARQSGQVQRGLASYYGPGFHGQQTASGEVFDQNQMVAAHRTLPLGSIVRVTNLENGRAVELRVIDRGPYGANRRKGTIIDVSKGAARRLGFIEDGLVRVRVEVLDEETAGEQ